ncbi:MAG: GDSL-type esterase/lipase family protein [Planctomycetales bacterium]|nr:GDSL-type esterase/lipase family protein [Planctomycetales bacterium]
MAAPRFSHYVALGDSIQTDDYPGAGRGAAALLHRNPAEFPEFAGRDLLTGNPGCRFTMLALDAATTRGVLDEQVPELEGLDPAPDLVTVTAGGNDFVELFGVPEHVGRDGVGAIAARIEEILGAVRRAAPAARVLVGTVYDPSDGTGELGGVTVDEWPPGPELLLDLNDTIRAVAKESRATLVDIHARFLGHGKRAGAVDGDPPGPADGPVWYCRLIEPNRRGAHEVRRAFWEALAL